MSTTSHRRLGIRELRADLAAAVRRAAAGERIVVMSNGRSIAQFGPLDDAAPDVERLIATGSLVPPRRTGAWRPPQPVGLHAGVRIDRALREIRG